MSDAIEQVAAPNVTRVPAEFIGSARVFRNAVRKTDLEFDDVLALITKPLRARLRHHPKLRAEMLPDLARKYDQMIPPEFRIGKVTGAHHKSEFAIEEQRICVSWFRSDGWEQQEIGVTIVRFTFSVHDGLLRERWRPVANVSMHALGRRLERGQDRSHAALERDLAVLVDTSEVPGERIATPGGFWLGAMITAMGEEGRALPLRSIRTWVGS
jgi:hypothetical protein